MISWAYSSLLGAKEAGAGADFVYSDEIALSADHKHLVDYHF